MGTVYIAIILVLRVSQNYFSKRISNLFPKSTVGKAKYLFTFFGVASVLSFIVTLATGSLSYIDSFSLILAIGGGILFLLGMAFQFIAMQNGTMVIASVFGTAGLIIPCIFGIFLFNEPMSVWQWLGIAIFIFAAYLLASSEKQVHSKFTFKKLLLLLALFVTEGSIGLSQKTLTFFRPDNADSRSIVFTFVTFLAPAIICGLYLLFKTVIPSKQHNDEKIIPENEKLNKKIFLPVSLFSATLVVITTLATLATSLVPAAILFGLINGGNSIIAAIVAAVVYREKPTVRSMAGLIIGIGALMMINCL